MTTTAARAHALSLVALAAVLATPLPASARGWREVCSPHFVVVGDAAEPNAREVALELERIRQVLVRLTDGQARYPRPSPFARCPKRRSAAELAPSSAIAREQLAEHLRERGRNIDEAVARARSAVALEPGVWAHRLTLEARPTSGVLMNSLGFMNAERGVKLEGALGLIDRALKESPTNASYLDSRGWALFRLGRTQDELRSRVRLKLAGRAAPAPQGP
jgi:tetratricopeptide (TPR) repeat protein